MPYLHWETDRTRFRLTDIMEDRACRWRQAKIDETKRFREQRIQARGAGKHPKHDEPRSKIKLEDSGSTCPTQRAMEDVVWRYWRRHAIVKMKNSDWRSEVLPPVDVDENRRLLVPDGDTKELGQFLVDAARMYEAMAEFQDRRVAEEGLFASSPLHPRRSLDQSYFWKLKSTRRRDRDQVVYRHTRHSYGKVMHKYTPMTAKDCSRNDRKQSQDNEQWHWDGHWRQEDDEDCCQCAEDIRRVPRAVMVDQLWLWILDEQTILTCFPQRTGAGRKDPSGVHYSIRARLKDQSNPANHVRSVFDLALIILRQCFDTFFDRTITPDKRPQVLDIFSESIGGVVSNCFSPDAVRQCAYMLGSPTDRPFTTATYGNWSTS